MTMLNNRYELSSFGFSFDGKDTTIQEVEYHLQARFQGIHPKGLDYITQPANYPKTGWQINGTSALGARACASVCRGFSFRPTTLRVTAWFSEEILNYELVSSQLQDWFIKNKPTVKWEEFTTGAGEKRCTWGTTYGRYNIAVETQGAGVAITFRIFERIEQAWQVLNYFDTGIEYEEACKRLWNACVNTYLAPNYFGLGDFYDISLRPEKLPDVKEDWWGYLSAVANKIKSQAKKENSVFLMEESLKFIERQLSAAIAREVRENNEAHTNTLQALESKVL